MRSSTHLATSFSCLRRQLRPGHLRPAPTASAPVASSLPSAPGTDNDRLSRWSSSASASTSTSTSTSTDIANTGTAQQPRWRQRSPGSERSSSSSSSSGGGRNSNSNSTGKVKGTSASAADNANANANKLWPVLRKLLHRPTLPVGSFTATEWQQARTVLTFHQNSAAGTATTEAAVALNNYSWSLLQRLVEEQAAGMLQHGSPHAGGAWLLQPAPVLHQMVKGWRNLVKLHRHQQNGSDQNGNNDHKKKEKVLSPAALLQGLEKLCTQLPGFSYDIKAFSMILDVAVQQSSTGQELQTADTFMAYIRKAAATKPALRPNVVTWNQCLSYHVKYSGTGGTDTVDKIQDLLRQMESKDSGVEPDVISFTQLLNAWAASGVPEAPYKMEELLLQKIQQGKIIPDVFCWTLVIKAWASTTNLPGAANKIASLLQRMQTEGGCTPNVVTYCHVLSFWAASGLSEAPTRAEEVLQRMAEEGCTPNVVTYTHVLKIYSDSGLTDAPLKMQEILERMKATGCQPDVVTWTQIIKAWAASGLPEAPAKMNECLRRMQEEGCLPSVVTWNQVLSYWAASKSPEAPDKVEEILTEMLPVQPSVVSYSIAIQACLRAEDPDRADALIDRMTAAGTSPTTRTFNELLAAWSKVGGIVAAEETEHIFRLMRDRSHDDPAVAPDIWSVSMVLAAWTRSGNSDALERVQDIYDQLEAGDFAGVKTDYVTCSSAVAFLAKSKRRSALERADQILRRFLDEHDGIVGKGQYDVYGILIRAWIEKKQVEKANSLLLHWEKCYSDGKYVPIPAIYDFRLVLLELIDSGDLERADAIFQHWQKLFSLGELEEGPNGPTSTKLCDGWRQSNHPEKERFLLRLENTQL